MRRLGWLAPVVAGALIWPAIAGASLPQQTGSVNFDASVNRLVIGPTGPGFEVGAPAYVGDVNGDGIGDFAIGAPDASNPSGQSTGAVYVVFGQAGLGSTVLPSSNGFVIYGLAAGDEFGASVADAGDLNGDGKSDIVIGAPGLAGGAGAAWVIYGKSSASEIDATSLGSQGYTISGLGAPSHVGASVSGLDPGVSGGPQGVIVGAPGDPVNGTGSGAVFVIPGLATPTHVDLGAPATIAPGGAYERAVSGAGGWIGYDGPAGAQYGISVAGIGDFDGGGKPDIAFGGYNGSDPAAFIAYGESNASGTSLTSPVTSEDLGASIAAAGDVNGDGLADVVIGDPTAAGGGTERGAAYILFGSRAPAAQMTTNLPGTAGGFAINGTVDDEELGSAVSGAGDVNGDGVADVIIGGDSAAGGGSDRGEALVVYGSTARDPATHPTTAGLPLTSASVLAGGGFGFGILGTHNGDAIGSAVGGGGDVTADGRADVLVASHSYNDLDGAVAVVRGFGQPAASYADVHGQVGVPLTATPAVTGRTGTPTFAASGPLPAGLSLDPATGTISGTPTAAGTSTGLVTMTDDASQALISVSFDIASAGGGNPGQCPAGQTGTPPNCTSGQQPPGMHCVVPRLHGKTLAAGRRALKRAHCAAGRVRKPKHHAKPPAGFKLVKVISKQSLPPGVLESPGTKVNLTLGYKRVRLSRHRH